MNYSIEHMKSLHKLWSTALGILLLTSGCSQQEAVLSLKGDWQVALDSLDVGIAQRWHIRNFETAIQLPGTLDDAGYGKANALLPSLDKPQVLHLTRKHRYVGPAWYVREVEIPVTWKGKGIELEMERVIWQTRVWVDGHEMKESEESLVSPHRYDLTEWLTPGRHRITIRVDNRKRYDISTGDMAHAYTDHTQIMWNGILGNITLWAHGELDWQHVQIYPQLADDAVLIKGNIQNRTAAADARVKVSIREKESGKLVGEHEESVNLLPGKNDWQLLCSLDKEVKRWSEFSPDLYVVELQVTNKDDVARESVTFGMREITRKGSDLLVNGQKVFLRGTLECCIFPLTGCPPTDRKGWLKVFQTAREWGLNHLRFHSWCPPKAAFEVADSMGFYLQVELPLWSLTVGTNPAMNRFLYDEARRILAEYGNHPSFCMLSLGNELQPDFQFLGELLDTVKALDPRHLYTTTSYTFERGHGDWPEPKDDYFITQRTRKGWVRGQGVFDVEKPNFMKDYAASVDSLSVPVVTHEIGQYAVYPDLKEISRYTGVLDPLNFKGVKLDLDRKGLLSKAEDYLMASGKLAAILYKEEMERAMKTPGISGYQLLDLHDFPGQGTALVGLLNAFWESKGVTTARAFRQSCAPVVPLARFPKAVYTNDEIFTADLELANYGAGPITEGELVWSLVADDGTVVKHGLLPVKQLKLGGGQVVGSLSCPLSSVSQAQRLKLQVALKGTDFQNSWNVWVYPAGLQIDYGEVVLTTTLADTRRALEAGKRVFFNPPYQQCVGLQGKFVPVFWSPVHFPKQAGTMGLLLDPAHPAFLHFPTENHTDWQWWSLATQSRTWVVDSLYTQLTPLVECVDNFANNRRLTNLFETNCLNGKLIVCSMDLQHDLLDYPEKKQLLHSLITYMKSDAFAPTATLDWDEMNQLVQECVN